MSSTPSVYRTIVADPPWAYDRREPGVSGVGGLGWPEYASRGAAKLKPLGYPSLTLPEIKALKVEEIAAPDCHLFLWTTNRYLRHAYPIVEAWGFRPSQLLTWCKAPMGLGVGGLFTNATEFIIYARRGKPTPYRVKVDRNWWEWPRAGHSVKPEAFLDLVESVCPGPYLEMFARRNRLGWDTWGNESMKHVEIESAS